MFRRLLASTVVMLSLVFAASGPVSADRPRRPAREPLAIRRARALAARLDLGTRTTASSIMRGHIEQRWTRAAGAGTRLPGTLRWPVANGTFVRGYGSGEGGYHQAIDIAARTGSPVRASAAGLVVYAGDEVSGYGNLVMIVHPGGWATMYAHNSRLRVIAGQKVARGTVVADVGSTGISRGPHVHFELFFQNENCDPAPLMRPGVLHRGGRIARLRYATWRIANRRPREVACDPRRRHPQSRHGPGTTPTQPEPTDEVSAPADGAEGEPPGNPPPAD